MSPKKHEKLNKDFYYGKNVDFYAKSQWMAKNQFKTSQRVLELIEDKRIGGKIPNNFEYLTILDLGCGTGYSTITLEDLDFKVIGIDLSMDMLFENQLQQKKIEKYNNQRIIPRILINASIEFIPLRSHSIHHVISISAFNFVLDNSSNPNLKGKILSRISNDLSNILKKNGRIVIEFYPKNDEIELYLNSFKNQFIGGLVLDNPNLRKEKKFMILKLIN